ncbi:MAG: DUF2721 domain-containing protein [Gemmataceae bacterium]
MFAPAILISAAGTLIMSTSTRLSRVVDRVRALSVEVAHPNPETSVEAKLRTTLVSDQLKSLFERAVLLRSAITVLYISVVLFVGTILAIGFVAGIEWRFSWIPVVSVLVGGSFLMFACIMLVREARLAVRTTVQEMDYVRELMTRANSISSKPD